MTDKTDLIREIHEYVTTHGGENTATHLLVQAASAIQTQAAELEAVCAGGVSGPLMGQPQAMPDLTLEACQYCEDDDPPKPLYLAAKPTAQAEGWRPISTAPRDGTEVLADTSGLGRVVVYWDDEESQWGTGLGYLDRGAPTHWMPLPPPPTSAEGVEP